MKELLFGWLLKPYYKITGLDEIIMLIEFAIVIFIGSIVYFTIQDLKEKIPKKIRIRGIYYRDYDEETDEMIDKEDMIIWELDNSYAYGDYYNEDGKQLFSNCYIVNRILNDEVEILQGKE